MPLVSSLPMIQRAREAGKAIAAFNIHNLETIQAVAEGAYEMRAPVIIQTTPGTLAHAGVEYIGAIVKKAADLYDIPIALHMDHCPSFDMIAACIRNHYTSVMIDGSHLAYEDNVRLVAKVVEMAHAVGVQVEGEIGRIGGVEDDLFIHDAQAAYTIPAEAVKFVEDTGVDTLAVAIGTAHGMYKGEPRLDFERLSAIHAAVNVPLVLHGASGVPDESVREAIRRGMAKVNIATELKIPMADAIKRIFAENPHENDPRKYMGAAKEAVKETVINKIKLTGIDNFVQ